MPSSVTMRGRSVASAPTLGENVKDMVGDPQFVEHKLSLSCPDLSSMRPR